jgi:hypothetical protein
MRPCKNGHVGLRKTLNSTCLECETQREKCRPKGRREYMAQYQRERRARQRAAE